MENAILPPEAYDAAENFHWHETTTAASGYTAAPGVLRPPKYTIDLSLPPEERYLHITPDFPDAAYSITASLKELTGAISWIPSSWAKSVARKIFRKMYDSEEHKELQGISKAIGLDLYILIILNTFLDVVMGCTSAGVRTHKDVDQSTSKVLHMRTLDWTMNPLRKLVIQLDFVDHAGGEVLYTSITYFGYVGVLTAVKKGLSLSLNSRHVHDKSTLKKRLSYNKHLLKVLVGKRRGIASELRQVITQPAQSPLEIAQRLRDLNSTAVYITLCDGQSTVILDNDNCCGRIRQDQDFIVAVNHDVQAHQDSHETLVNNINLNVTIRDYIILMSTERQEAMEGLWRRDQIGSEKTSGVLESQLLKWLETCREVSCEDTHFGMVMDPTKGKIIWLQRYLEPLIWSEHLEKDVENGASEIPIRTGVD